MVTVLAVFIPWFSSVTRSFVFAGWSTTTVAAVTICVVLLLVGLSKLSKRSDCIPWIREATSYKLAAIIALLFGASLIYAVGGGFSLDSRKKYPLLPLMLLLGCWTFRYVFKTYKLSAHAFLACGAFICVAAAMTTWLVVGIWKYETARYNSLAEFIAKHELQGDRRVYWKPDLNRAGPQMRRSMGYSFDDVWVLNLAVEYRGGRAIGAASDSSTVIEYAREASRWVLINRPSSLQR